ncbi:MAG: hypothetical protein AAF614_04485 [Chloroflexota bacterium]
MKSQPGAELACRGHNFKLPAGEGAKRRGVVSYYAVEALPQVNNLDDWLTLMQELIQQDVADGKLPIFYQPELQILGDGSQSI